MSGSTFPNILLLVAEDSGCELGCYGDPYARTPAIDALAAEGVRFDLHYTPHSVCSPARASLYTGLHPHQNGQIGLATHKYAMYERFPNLFSVARAAGYRTGLLGKLHVNPEDAFPIDHWWNPPESISFGQRDVRRVAAEARAFMDGPGPFCLVVAFPDAHLPLIRQDRGIPERPHEPDEVSPLPHVGVDTPRLRGFTADYYSCLARLDFGVGLVLDELAAAGLDGDTLVAYTSDHGAQFSRGKSCLYEAGTRVPLILRLPGSTRDIQGPPAAASRAFTSHVDVLPTLCAAAGLTCPPVAGRSLLSLLAGPAPRDWPDYAVTQLTGGAVVLFNPSRAIRDERYKLIVNYQTGPVNPVAWCYDSLKPAHFAAGTTHDDLRAASPRVREAYDTWRRRPPLELYDLVVDPTELVNRATDPSHEAERARLLDALAAWQIRERDPYRDPEKVARMIAEVRHTAERYPDMSYRTAPGFAWRYAEYLAPEGG